MDGLTSGPGETEKRCDHTEEVTAGSTASHQGHRASPQSQSHAQQPQPKVAMTETCCHQHHIPGERPKLGPAVAMQTALGSAAQTQVPSPLPRRPGWSSKQRTPETAEPDLLMGCESQAGRDGVAWGHGLRGAASQAHTESQGQLCHTHPPSTVGLRLEREEQKRELLSGEWDKRRLSANNTPHSPGLG